MIGLAKIPNSEFSFTVFGIPVDTNAVLIPKIIHQIGSKIAAIIFDPWTPKNQKNEIIKTYKIANPNPSSPVAKPMNYQVKNL
ncbi:hypothetical protein P344_00495 [Spiroplasma mirum ATCC 29335]|uniref:Uncharacterized protein n=1 Tax=Spiroplasma mirum ATCC 29335 TaxID=838561 RepID=W6AJY1_9MOLU|nr:hypothetical protein P344_00495 [Spiroplasma mirum ATCC 29335]